MKHDEKNMSSTFKEHVTVVHDENKIRELTHVLCGYQPTYEMKQYAEHMVQQRDELWENKLTKMLQYDDTTLGTVVMTKSIADIINLIKQQYE